MIRLSFIAALTLLAAAPSLPQAAHRPASAARHREYRPIESIRWSYGKESGPGSAWQLRFKHGQSDSSIADDPDVRAVTGQIAHAEPGRAIAFSLAREAGTIACTGLAEPGTGIRTRQVRLQTPSLRSRPFPWSVVGADAIGPIAAGAGLTVHGLHTHGDRWFAVLEKAR